MNTQVPAPGGQPGQPNDATPTQASEQPQNVNVDAYTSDQLLAAITGTPEEKPLLDELPPAPAEPAKPSEQPEPEPAKGKEETPPEENPARKENLRLRLTALPTEQQQETAEAYRMVAAGEAVDMLEAYQKLRNVQPASQAPAQANADPAAAPAAQEPANPQPSEVDSLQSRLTELRDQRKQAKQDFDTDAEEELTTQIEDVTRQLAKAEAKAEAVAEFTKKSEAEARKAWSTEYEKAVDELEDKYPATLDDHSPFTRLLDAKIQAAKASNDPRLSDPRHILALADELDAELKELAPKPSGVKPSPPPSAPRATGAAVAPAQAPTQRISDQQAAAMFYDEKTSADDILAALMQ